MLDLALLSPPLFEILRGLDAERAILSSDRPLFTSTGIVVCAAGSPLYLRLPFPRRLSRANRLPFALSRDYNQFPVLRSRGLLIQL